jgi:hypothetical protein
MRFDEKGYLQPYAVIETTLADFEHFFVQSLENREHRYRLFENYLRFVNALREAFDVPFYQLINGSFTTLREFPADIDLVTFIKFEVLNNKYPLARHFLENAKILYGVDGYFAATCRRNHYYYDTSLNDEAYWVNLYGRSREDENGLSYPKGIIKIQF